MMLLMMLTTATAWAIGGSGTSSDPYTIANYKDWNTFCYNFGSYKDKYIKLTANFTTSNFLDRSTPFTGNFDGAGHTITLDYNLQGMATGLFRYVDAPGAVIKNLNVAGTIYATQNVTPSEDGIGGIVGKLGQGTVQNCTSSVTIKDNGYTLGHVGGVVGAIYAATVQDCSFTGTLSCGNSSDCIGGIVGYAKYDKSFVIKSCLSTGTISVKSTTGAGAILGYVKNNNHTSNSKSNYWKTNGVNQTNGGGGSIGGASKTDAQLKSGQISRLLNGGNGSTESANGAWGNTVGSNYPTLGGTKVYKVSFNANGGNGSMSDAYTNASPLPSNSFTLSGYGFGGWSTSANGSPISEVSSDGTLYALWLPPVNYIDADGSSKSVIAKSLLSGWTTLSAGWYVVNNNVTLGSRITCTGAVYLILADGKTLTASKGITVNSGNSLTIYGQSGQTGKLTTGTPNDFMAGIGGGENQSSGNITINGGTVNATGGYNGAGIGSGRYGNGSVTINGGTVNATGGVDGSGIGGGNRGNGSVTINGGTVNATGGSYGSGIGGGYRGNGSVTINGGYIKATAGEGAAAIGNGYYGSGSTINITGGMFASGNAGGNKIYGITPSNGYAVFSSGNTTYPYQVCQAATVTFKANGGTGDDYDQYIKKNTATALAANTFKHPNGFTFQHWNTADDDTGTSYANGQSVTLNADLTLYAQWKGVLTNSMIADIAAQAYTGSAITPTVTVSFDGEQNLTLNTDYTVSYANNVNAGTATVTVTGKGNYTGTATKTFMIYSNQNLVGATITLPYTCYAYKGSALTPIPTVKYGETTLTEGTDYTLLYSDNTNAGMATVTVTAKGNYTGANSATFTIVNIPLNGGTYQIGTPEQLLAFMELCNDNSSTTYSAQQTADIDLNNADWTGIGSFKGTYDGQYHTILRMGRNNQHTQIGVNPFMGTIETGATVKDLTISEAIVWPGHGDAGFFAGNNKGTMSRCVAIGGRVQSGWGHVGGIAGYNNGTMTDCAVINSAVNHRWSAGGASHTGGVVQQNNGTMQNCFAYGVNYSANNTPEMLGGINLENKAPTNSYFYNTHSFFTDDDASNNSSVDGTLITADQSGSGQTARLLNGGNGTAESASGAWGQTIGKDKYPVLGGPAVYKVTYDANEGTGTMDAQYLNSGQALAACDFNAQEGYYFNGWNTSQDGTGTKYDDKADVTLTGDLKLYAQWAPTWAGKGTKDNPYIIENTFHLDLLAHRVNGTHGETLQADGYSGKFFKLGADITYSHTTAWNDATSTESNFEAIGGYYGGSYRDFLGDFDGDGHTISGIRIYKGDDDYADMYQGLFGRTDDGANIHAVTLADTRITGYDYTGGIVGDNWGTVSDCHVAANVAVCAVQSWAYYHGGIVGCNNWDTVSGCTSAVTLSLTDAASSMYYGGIAGLSDGGLRDNLVIGASMPAARGNTYGAITGYNYDSTLERNYYTACKVANVENATGVGCGYIDDGNGGHISADVTENDGAVPALRDNADNSTAIGLLAAHASTANGHVPVDLGWGAGKYPVQLAGRTLYKNGAWNTLCLPFAVSDISTSPLAGATIMELDTKGTYDNGKQTGVDGTTLNLYFKEVTTIEAGKPYLIKWDGGDNLVNPVFSGVEIQNVGGGSQNDDQSVCFTGTFNALTDITTLTTPGCDVLLMGDDKLHYADSGESLGAFRAYFLIDPTKVANNRLTDYHIDLGNGKILTGTLGITPGDANGDGKVTVTDIAVVVNHILQLPNADFSLTGADANGDGEVTVTDIGVIVDIILGNNADANAKARYNNNVEPQ